MLSIAIFTRYYNNIDFMFNEWYTSYMLRNLLLDKDNKETLLYDNSGFPVFIGLNELSRFALGYVPWHWHNELQFCVVTKGTVTFKMHGEEHNLASGDGIFFNSGVLHMAQSKDNDGTYICVNADKKLISSFPGGVIDEKYVSPFSGSSKLSFMLLSQHEPWSASALANITEIFNSYETKEYGFELIICSKLMYIWKTLIGSGDHDTRSPAQHDARQRVMKDIIKYIEINYPERITLDDIANLVHLSKGECCRAFKRDANTTIFNYLTSYRVQKSAELLTTSDMSISQVASAVGFSSPSYFTEMFKKYTNQTPSDYRSTDTK